MILIIFILILEVKDIWFQSKKLMERHSVGDMNILVLDKKWEFILLMNIKLRRL